jgi:hypothetical protein
MSSLKEDTPRPDPSELGRNSHLRILTVNRNTVRHPKEGSKGTAVEWSGSKGEKYQAQFQYEEPDFQPQVLKGERVEWINLTNQPCTIVFDKTDCEQSPFQDGARQFTIAPGRSVFSGLIDGPKNRHYPYLVNFVVPPDTQGGQLGDPEIIVK